MMPSVCLCSGSIAHLRAIYVASSNHLRAVATLTGACLSSFPSVTPPSPYAFPKLTLCFTYASARLATWLVSGFIIPSMCEEVYKVYPILWANTNLPTCSNWKGRNICHVASCRPETCHRSGSHHNRCRRNWSSY